MDSTQANRSHARWWRGC